MGARLSRPTSCPTYHSGIGWNLPVSFVGAASRRGVAMIGSTDQRGHADLPHEGGDLEALLIADVLRDDGLAPAGRKGL
jgi:hypothetical protein